MSSVRIQTCGWRSSTSARPFSSSRVYAAPEGLEGEFRISQRVRGVITASSSAGFSLKPLAAVVGAKTGVPPASRTMSG